MPAYDFGCDTCGHFWEETRPMAECDSPSACPKCADPGRRAWLTPPRGGMKMVDVSGYHPGLALKPGDPEAWVDGRHSLQKLVDKRQREGHGPPIDNS